MKEWVITNGIGGFASSTDFAGMNTRRYHGLLVAAMEPPEERTLILSKVDESIEISGKKYNLYTNDVVGIKREENKYLINFEKDVIPVYTFKVQKTIVEKSICMIYGMNAVVIRYKISNQRSKTKLNLTPLLNCRDFHQENHSKIFNCKQHNDTNRVQVEFKNGTKINFGVGEGVYKADENNMFYNMYYEKEDQRGFLASENHYIPGTFTVDIKPNEDKEITFICAVDGKTGLSYEHILDINGSQVIQNEIDRINTQIKDSEIEMNLPDNPEEQAIFKDLLRKYIIASDNFIVYRSKTKLHTLIAGYPWFLDWGRDAFIAFEGLLLMSKRYGIAREVLLTFTNKVKKGLIPNGFSEYDGKPMYNSADASLLLFEAVNKYIDYTGDYDFVRDNLFETMKKIIDYYIDGTNVENNNIYLDDRDFLIVSGSEKTQNTWMDARVNGVAVTPRNGKAVEINALWYNALKVMQKICEHYRRHLLIIEYSYIANKTKKNFIKKFYNPDKKCLFDVIGDDKVRPNQLFAFSLSYPVVECDSKIAKETFITVTQKLLNKYGLKTLAADEKEYVGVYRGNPSQRDSIYHQGITWPWLLGLYYNTLKNMIMVEENDETKNDLKSTLLQFKVNIANVFANELMNGNTIGSISELYDSDGSGNAKGAFAQAWSVSEIFRILLENNK